MSASMFIHESNYMGWVFHSLSAGETIFIPFVCRKCGKCCRKVSIDPSKESLKIFIEVNKPKM